MAYNAGLHDYPSLVRAIAISWAESRWALIPNSEGSSATGAWQIETSVWPFTAAGLLSSWPYNGRAFIYVLRHQGWSAWNGDGAWNCWPSACIPAAYADADRVIRLADR